MLRASLSTTGVWAGIFALFLFLCFLTFDLIEEDAYIYFRFAANMANGYGYVFNQSGPPVEAGSSLIWQLLLVPLYFFDPEMVIGTKVMGVCFGLLSLIMTHKVMRCFVENKALSYIPVVWLVCSYPFFLWSHLGLETPLLIFLALAFLYCVIDETAFRYWPLAAFLVVNVRPEGFMLCALLIPPLFRNTSPRIEPRQLLIFVALVLVVVFFRLVYFQDVVPNSFYHKINVGGKMALRTLWNFLLQSLTIIPFIIGIAAILSPRSYNFKFGSLAIATAITLIWGAVGSDFKFFDRSFAIALPFIYIMATCSLNLLYERFHAISNTLTAPFILALALFGAALLLGSTSEFTKNQYSNPLLKLVDKNLAGPFALSERIGHWFTPHKHLERGSIYWPFLYDNHQAIMGEFLTLNYPKNISIVYSQMGQVPWYAGLDKHFIDSVGLVNKPVGYALFNYKMKFSAILRSFDKLTSPVIKLFGGEPRDGWSRETAVDYIFDQKPEVIVLHTLISYYPEGIPGMIKNDERLKNNYVMRYAVNLARVYERRDITWDRDKVQFPKNCRCRIIPDLKADS